MASLHQQIKQSRAFDSLEQEAFLNLLRTAGLLGGTIEHLLKRHGLSTSQYNVLRILRGQSGPGLPCNSIGERMVNRVPDVTRLVDKLVRQGLAARRRSSEDRRVVLISITDAGRHLLAELDEPLRNTHLQLLQHMTAREMRELNRLLVKARIPVEGD